jgi:hypothetical protein
MTENTEPGGMPSFAAILRPDIPRAISFATSPRRLCSVGGLPSFAPRSRAAARPALMRSRITLRSNSATAANTCICNRPAGLLSLVSIPCESAPSGSFLPRVRIPPSPFSFLAKTKSAPETRYRNRSGAAGLSSSVTFGAGGFGDVRFDSFFFSGFLVTLPLSVMTGR